jgi:hypothetical protein
MTTTRRKSLIAVWVTVALLLAAPAASAHEPESTKPKPQSASSTFTVDPVASLSTPFVEVSGTLSCDDPSAAATIVVDIGQRAKGEEIGTVGIEDVSCSSGTWSMSLRSDAGELGGAQFKPGKADLVAGAFICDSESCTVEEVRATIKVLPG